MIGKSPQPLTARTVRTVRRFPRGFLRRGVLRALFTLGVASFSGGALARVAATPPEGERPGRRPMDGRPRHRAFDEMYKGRRIQGRPVSADAAEFEVLVDGRPLHLMRCANGGYLTLVDHYSSYPTPLAATRAAVDELGTAQLAPAVAHGSGLAGSGLAAPGPADSGSRGDRGAHA
ncbi:tyrosinase family oxidase copper chaperone [Streptomyces sp. TRM64462]|uniref:tyrosinase family oxidase copper chaperone n=1 Tax=Streptomyces sp. TRM64462 TaxID=2741726 RepID=UPI0015860C73|nr:tyrosinase family oxidase copper chaperone [Streptomyces sp. TRM64462]